jgi:HD-GYP domain-containing protein (c-di-GMP phosphodiesterase class II)
MPDTEKKYSQALDAQKMIQRLTDIGAALSAEEGQEVILEKILLEAQDITCADGGTLYYRTDDDTLTFAIMRNESLGIAMGGTTGVVPAIAPIHLYDPATRRPNLETQSVYAVITGKQINIDDVYEVDIFDFKGTKAFDAANNYRTKSVITLPMLNHKKRAMGCLQLINAKDPETGEVVAFSKQAQEIVMSLASQAAIILDNKQLIHAHENLLESFIRLLAKAIDDKSPYTGAHCERVPVLTEMLAEAGCKADYGCFADFNLSPEEKYELHVAAWLHDCGKVVTPVHIMDKATKLETIHDRIDAIKTRYEVLKRDAWIAYYEARDKATSNHDVLEIVRDTELTRLESELQFIINANVGGEFMKDEDIERLKKIGSREFSLMGIPHQLLTENEVHNLSTRRGTITDEERKIMNDHMVHTMKMLQALPFPKHLKRVPEYAIGHHERMDGKGYPQGIKAGDMSIPARMMAVADVFEALTANDRPYKQAKKLSEAMKIIGFMKKEHHLDPEMVDLFVKEKVYLEYAKKYLDASLIDSVDEEFILGITPPPLAA